MPVSLNDILSSIQQGVQAVRSVAQKLETTFLQSGVVVSTAITTTGSTITFSSSQAAGFMAVISSSGAAYYLPLYR